jgi:hypothetical protein
MAHMVADKQAQRPQALIPLSGRESQAGELFPGKIVGQTQELK